MSTEKLTRALTVADLLSYKPKTLPLTGEWLECMGAPEQSGGWLIWGGSFSGKTSFSVQLAYELSKHTRVLYNSLEQGKSESLKQAFILNNIPLRAKNLLMVKESYSELITRLNRPKSPNVVFTDSLQYFDITYKEYKALKELFPKKLFVFISHADQKQPAGSVAKKIRYDADVKIWVEGYKAFAESRVISMGKPYTIYQEGADRYWLDNK